MLTSWPAVLVAEKTAQANVIARRGEVASTRSLLNTAKLMDENKTLYKLKELEYLERICRKGGRDLCQWKCGDRGAVRKADGSGAGGVI